MIECEQKIERMKCLRAIGDITGKMLWRDGRCDQEINERMIHWMIDLYEWINKWEIYFCYEWMYTWINRECSERRNEYECKNVWMNLWID